MLIVDTYVLFVLMNNDPPQNGWALDYTIVNWSWGEIHRTRICT